MNLNIVKLLASNNLTERQLGLVFINEQPEQYAFELLEAIARLEGDSRNELITYSRSRFPFLSETFHSTNSVINSHQFEIGEQTCQQEKRFLQGVAQWMDIHQVNPERCIEILSDHKALHAEYESLIKSRWKGKNLEIFRGLCKLKESRPHKQLGIIPTYQCNRHCTYCLSDEMHKEEADFEDIKKVLLWASESAVKQIRFYGGEPTVYPYFEELMSEIVKRGFRVSFPTNLMTTGKELEAMHAESIDVVICHIRSLKETDNDYDLFLKNARRLKEKNVRFVLRYNLFNENWEFLLNAIKTLSCKELWFASIVTPDSAKTSTREQWSQVVSLVARFSQYLLDHHVKPILAKPVPLCAVADNDFKYLWSLFRGHCNSYKRNHTYNTIVRPDMTVGLCDGDFCKHRPSLWSFENWDAMEVYVSSKMHSWQTDALWSICKNCYYNFRGLCQGGCLAVKGKKG